MNGTGPSSGRQPRPWRGPRTVARSHAHEPVLVTDVATMVIATCERLCTVVRRMC
jgi:hypothetical protein